MCNNVSAVDWDPSCVAYLLSLPRVLRVACTPSSCHSSPQHVGVPFRTANASRTSKRAAREWGVRARSADEDGGRLRVPALDAWKAPRQASGAQRQQGVCRWAYVDGRMPVPTRPDHASATTAATATAAAAAADRDGTGVNETQYALCQVTAPSLSSQRRSKGTVEHRSAAPPAKNTSENRKIA